LDPAPLLLQKAEAQGILNARDYFPVGMQEHAFDVQYDCIWIQWAAGFLLDTDLIKFLIRARQTGLRDRGLVVVKDNVCEIEGQWRVDRAENVITRSMGQMQTIFGDAGYSIIHFSRVKLSGYSIVCFAMKPVGGADMTTIDFGQWVMSRYKQSAQAFQSMLPSPRLGYSPMNEQKPTTQFLLEDEPIDEPPEEGEEDDTLQLLSSRSNLH
jgi:hypothetical protein